MGRSNLSVVSGVLYGFVSVLVAEPRIAEVLGVGDLCMTRKKNSIDSRSVSILSTLVWTTSGSPDLKQSTRAPKQAWLDLLMINKFPEFLGLSL